MSFKKLWRNVDNAGDKQSQVNALMAIWIIASQAFISGAEDLRVKANLFVHRLESWRDDLLFVFRGQPFVISDDEQRAKKFFWGAVASLLIEVVLGTAIASRNGLPLWTGVFIALTLAIVFDALFVLAWLRAKRYREALDKLRRFLLYPAGIIFGIALPIFLLGRMVRGQMAASLATVVSVSLWLSTLSLLVLGATLLACAFIYRWTKRDKADFDEEMAKQTALRVTMDKTLRELLSRGVDTDPLVEQLRNELKTRNLLGVISNQTSPRPAGLLSNAATAVKLLPVLLVALALSNSSCTQANSDTPNAPVQEQSTQQSGNQQTTPVDFPMIVPPANSEEIDLIVGLDGTGSGHPGANEMLARNFKRDDARIFAALGVRNLRIFEFIHNGRVPIERKNIDLPKFIRPQTLKADAGDAGIMNNIEEAVEEDSKAQAGREFRAALTGYANEMSKFLSGLTEDHFMPSSVPEPKCSDINGFLAFLTTSSGERRRAAVLISDGKESCSEGIMTIAIPDDLTLIIMVLPLSPEEADDAQGIDTKFQERLDRIKKALPNAFVVPYNADIYKVLLDAVKKSQLQNKAVQQL